MGQVIGRCPTCEKVQNGIKQGLFYTYSIWLLFVSHVLKQSINRFLAKHPPKEHHKITVFSSTLFVHQIVLQFVLFHVLIYIYINKYLWLFMSISVSIPTVYINVITITTIITLIIVIIIVIIDIIVFPVIVVVTLVVVVIVTVLLTFILSLSLIISLFVEFLPNVCLLSKTTNIAQHWLDSLTQDLDQNGSDMFGNASWKPRWIPGMAICTGKSIHKPFFWVPFWFPESVSTNLFARVNGWLGRDSFATWKHIWFNWAILLPILAQDWSS